MINERLDAASEPEQDRQLAVIRVRIDPLDPLEGPLRRIQIIIELRLTFSPYSEIPAIRAGHAFAARLVPQFARLLANANTMSRTMTN